MDTTTQPPMVTLYDFQMLAAIKDPRRSRTHGTVADEVDFILDEEDGTTQSGSQSPHPTRRQPSHKQQQYSEHCKTACGCSDSKASPRPGTWAASGTEPHPGFGLRLGQLAGRTSGRLSLPGAAARGSPHTCHTLGSVTRPGFCGFRRVVVDDARVSDPDSGQVPRFAVGSGRPGRIRSAYRRSVRAAREARAVEPWHEVYVEIGEKLAAIADSAAAAGDAKGLVNVARDLQDVLDLLPVRRAVGVSGESGSGSGAGVLHLLSSEPEMGDTANT